MSKFSRKKSQKSKNIKNNYSFKRWCIRKAKKSRLRKPSLNEITKKGMKNQLIVLLIISILIITYILIN
jgi:3-methyladenine DNA glycosylase AlkD